MQYTWALGEALAVAGCKEIEGMEGELLRNRERKLS
jgi:hypothetical protein